MPARRVELDRVQVTVVFVLERRKDVQTALAVSGAAFEHVLGSEVAGEEIEEAREGRAEDDPLSILARCDGSVLKLPVRIVLDRQLGRFSSICLEFGEQPLRRHQGRGEIPANAGEERMVPVRHDTGSRLETEASDEHMRPMVGRHGRPDDSSLQRKTATTEHADERGHGSQAFERVLNVLRTPLSHRDDRSHAGGTSSPVSVFQSSENGPSQSFTLRRRRQ